VSRPLRYALKAVKRFTLFTLFGFLDDISADGANEVIVNRLRYALLWRQLLLAVLTLESGECILY